MEHAEKSSAALDLSFFEEEVWDTASDTPEHDQRPAVEEDWLRFFREDQYDWNDPEWLKKTKRGKYAWRKISINKQRPGSKKRGDTVPSGYFMAVSPADYDRLLHHEDGSKKSWVFKIAFDKNTGKCIGAYARRYGRRGEEPGTVNAHREVMDCLQSNLMVDHYNGYGLDNRGGKFGNLKQVRRSENTTNCSRTRTKNTELPVGVEIRKRGGEIRYGGTRRVRVSKKKVLCIRSKRVWKTPEPAARWYQNQIKERFRRETWCKSPVPLLFPPRLEAEPTKRSLRLRKKAMSSDARVRAEIPF